MKLSEVQRLLNATCLNSCAQEDKEVSRACAADLLSDVLAFTETNTVLLTGLIHGQVIRTAEMLDLAAVVVVRGKSPSEDMLAIATEKGIPLFGTDYNMYTAVGKLYQAGLRGMEE
ncbi:MAG: DRTGG domain-containing protein [Clostridiales bacterium]